MTLQEYFSQPDAERILLIEITRNDADNTVYYLADNDYITEPTHTPANTQYTAIIGGTGIGDIRKTLNDPFDGQASTGFGTITLVDTVAWSDQAGNKAERDIVLKRGAQVKAWVAGPPRQFDRSTAIKIIDGTIGRVGGDSMGNLTFEILDGSQAFFNAKVEVGTKPLCFGYCRNVTPFLTNPSTLEYHVHDGAIEEVVAVYDQGVLLTLTTDYTVDLANGKITLVSSPVGVVTADIKGAKVSSVWLDSTQEIIAELISRAGVTVTQNYNLPTGIVGLYVETTKSLGELLNTLTRACAGYWLIDSSAEFYAAQYPVPGESTTVASFTPIDILNELTYNAVDRVYDSVRYTYRKNWTQYQSFQGATSGQADFSQSLYLESVENSTSADSETVYDESPIIETLFDSQADAEILAERLLSIYEVTRSLYTLNIPYIYGLNIGDNVNVQFDTKDATGAIVSIIDRFDGTFPTQQIQVLA